MALEVNPVQYIMNKFARLETSPKFQEETAKRNNLYGQLHHCRHKPEQEGPTLDWEEGEISSRCLTV